MALKPQIKMLWTSEDDWNKAMQANQFRRRHLLGSARVWRAQRKFNLPVELVIPKEGVIGWFDGLDGGPRTRPHADVAQQFIDFMVSPEFYVKWETDVGRADLRQRRRRCPSCRRTDPSKALVAEQGGDGPCALRPPDLRRAQEGVPGDVGRGQGLLREVSRQRRAGGSGGDGHRRGKAAPSCRFFPRMTITPADPLMAIVAGGGNRIHAATDRGLRADGRRPISG